MKIQVDFGGFFGIFVCNLPINNTETHKLTSLGHNLYDMIGKGYLVDNGAIYYRDEV